METKTLANTLADVEAEAIGKNVADTQAVVGHQKTCDRLGDVRTEALLDTQANAHAKVDSKTPKDHFAMCSPRNWSTILPRR